MNHSHRDVGFAILLISALIMMLIWQSCQHDDRLDELERHAPAPVSQGMDGLPSMASWCSQVRHWGTWEHDFLCLPA